MAPTLKPKLISVDTNFLLDLAGKNETVLDCLELVKSKVKNSQVLVVPTVLQELASIATTPRHSGSALAMEALISTIKQHGFTPINCLPVGHGIVEITGQKIRDLGLLPESEVNDSFVIAESAIADAAVLISSDRHIHQIDHSRLNALLKDCHLPCPLLVSPFKITKQFRSA